MFEPLKITYINRDEILERFVAENQKYKGKKLEISISSQSYDIKYGNKLLDLVQPLTGYEFRETGRVYGYCRISRKEQSIDRQIRNILKEYPSAKIYQEAYTGTKMEGRKELEKVLKVVKPGDTIVFDSVSRMSRNSYDGVRLYFDLFDRGINLIFLKEHYIDTDIYKESLKDKIELQGTDEDEIFKGLNNYFRKLAVRQIKIAFDQSEKEVEDLHQRTKEGIQTARINGKQIGQVNGSTLNIKKKAPKMDEIRKYSKDFEGNLNDTEVMKLTGLARNTYYKYKREMKEV